MYAEFIKLYNSVNTVPMVSASGYDLTRKDLTSIADNLNQFTDDLCKFDFGNAEPQFVLAKKTFTVGTPSTSGFTRNEGSMTDYGNKDVEASSNTSDSTYTYINVPTNGYYNEGSRIKILTSKLGAVTPPTSAKMCHVGGLNYHVCTEDCWQVTSVPVSQQVLQNTSSSWTQSFDNYGVRWTATFTGQVYIEELECDGWHGGRWSNVTKGQTYSWAKHNSCDSDKGGYYKHSQGIRVTIPAHTETTVKKQCTGEKNFHMCENCYIRTDG